MYASRHQSKASRHRNCLSRLETSGCTVKNLTIMVIVRFFAENRDFNAIELHFFILKHHNHSKRIPHASTWKRSDGSFFITLWEHDISEKSYDKESSYPKIFRTSLALGAHSMKSLRIFFKPHQNTHGRPGCDGLEQKNATPTHSNPHSREKSYDKHYRKIFDCLS